MRVYAFWLSLLSLFNERALSRNTGHPVIVHQVLNAAHPQKSQPKLQRANVGGPKRLLQHERRANSTSVRVAASRHKNGAGKKKVKVSVLNPDQEEAYLKGYTMQFVGLANNGIEPRDSMDVKANRCMVAGEPSESGGATGGGGIGLTWEGCPHFVQKDQYGVPTGDAKEPTKNQLYQFTLDGKVRHVGTGKCLRRTKCGIDPGPMGPPLPYAYDLGFCDEKGTVRVQIWKSRARRADLTMPVGNALNAVEGTCKTCGPFKMMQVCKGPCDMVEVTTGWTKQPSAYTVKKEALEKGYLTFGPFKDGLCKSYVKDEEGLASWWYFHKYDIPK